MPTLASRANEELKVTSTSTFYPNEGLHKNYSGNKVNWVRPYHQEAQGTKYQWEAARSMEVTTFYLPYLSSSLPLSFSLPFSFPYKIHSVK